MAIVTRYVNTASSGGDGTTNAEAGGTAAYASLAAMVTGESGGTNTGDDLVVICSTGSGSAADTLQANLAGFTYDSVTIQAATGEEASAAGWSTSNYRIELAQTFGAVIVVPAALTCSLVDLQVRNSEAARGNQGRGIDLNTGAATVLISGCRIEGAGSTGTADAFWAGIYIDGGDNASWDVTVVNNVIIGFGANIHQPTYIGTVTSSWVFYNNTLIDGEVYNFFSNWDDTTASGEIHRKNNLCQGGVTDWQDNGNISDDTSANITEDATSPNGASFQSLVVTFENEGSGDYRLASGDGNARDAGIDLSADGTYAFSTDIEGSTRSGSWDVGAHEFASGSGTSMLGDLSAGFTFDITALVNFPTESEVIAGFEMGGSSSVGDIVVPLDGELTAGANTSDGDFLEVYIEGTNDLTAGFTASPNNTELNATNLIGLLVVGTDLAGSISRIEEHTAELISGFTSDVSLVLSIEATLAAGLSLEGDTGLGKDVEDLSRLGAAFVDNASEYVSLGNIRKLVKRYD